MISINVNRVPGAFVNGSLCFVNGWVISYEDDTEKYVLMDMDKKKKYKCDNFPAALRKAQDIF